VYFYIFSTRFECSFIPHVFPLISTPAATATKATASSAATTAAAKLKKFWKKNKRHLKNLTTEKKIKPCISASRNVLFEAVLISSEFSREISLSAIYFEVRKHGTKKNIFTHPAGKNPKKEQ
jgi:hypothetical protein